MQFPKLTEGGRFLPPFPKEMNNSINSELKSGLISVERAEKECDVYCPICHKLLHVQKGQVIPRCCGKTMQPLD